MTHHLATKQMAPTTPFTAQLPQPRQHAEASDAVPAAAPDAAQHQSQNQPHAIKKRKRSINVAAPVPRSSPDTMAEPAATPGLGSFSQQTAAAAHGQDSAALAALFSCAGHLLWFQSKSWFQSQSWFQSKSPAGAVQKTSTTAAAQEKQMQGQAVADGVNAQMNDDDSGQLSTMPWVVSSLTDQLTHLAELMKLPWQLCDPQKHAVQSR